MTRRAIVDAGPLYAAADEADRHHGQCLQVLNLPDLELIVPALVLAEVCYFVGRRVGPSSEADYVEKLTRRTTIATPHDSDWPRIVTIMRQYRDLRIGTVDASIVALAERVNVSLLLTLDRRHFGVVRPAHVAAFEILP